MTTQQRPHPANVPGPFYVTDGCCTSCGVPEMAPENFQFLPDGHCYVSRQPDDAQLERVLRVVRTQEFGCIRYRGSDPVLLQRLAEAGEAAQCDSSSRPPIAPVLRKFVSFASLTSSAADELVTLRRELLAQFHSSVRGTDIVGDDTSASFAIAWFADDFHSIKLGRQTGDADNFLLEHTGPVALSELIDDVLRAGPYRHVQWSSTRSGEHGSSRPW